MKLNIHKAGNGSQTNEINIRNPNAQVSNLRAAIAISMKVEPHSFRISSPSGAIEDETKKLTEVLKEGDTVTITMKRDREDAVDVHPEAAAVTRRVSSPTSGGHTVDALPPSSSSAPSTRTAPPAPAATTSSSSSAFVPDPAIVQQLADMGFPGDQIPLALERSNNSLEGATSVLLSGTLSAPAARRNTNVDRPNLLAGSFSDDEEEEDDEDDEEWQDETTGEEAEEDAERAEESLEQMLQRVTGDDATAGEQVRLLQQLSTLYPDQEDLSRRFEENPQSVLAEIQTNHPDLFGLITRNHEFFLHFVQDHGSEDDSSAGDDEDDILGDVASSEEDNDAPPSAAVPPPAVAPASTGGSSSAPTAPRELNERDTANIENLVQLGFDRQRATDAYFRHGRNPDRAAAWLFDNPA